MRKRIIVLLPLLILLCVAAEVLLWWFGPERLRLKTGTEPAVSLIYQVLPVPGETPNPKLVQVMARRLQRRIDPYNELNLAFIPLPNSQLEVWAPLSLSDIGGSVQDIKRLLQGMGIQRCDHHRRRHDRLFRESITVSDQIHQCGVPACQT